MDWGGDNPISALRLAPILSLAGWNSRRKGVIDARTMGIAFTWLRPDDLVWSYWINNYLLGRPPKFDILAWNADGTNLPARLHAQFLDMFDKNPLVHKGARTYLDVPVDLSTLDVPTFVVGGVNDHLTPWLGTYRTTELTGGDSTYVLSNAGHVACVVNPPGNPKASYFVGPDAGDVDAETWRQGAERRTGSWWTEWAEWTKARAGAEVDAPSRGGQRTAPGAGRRAGSLCARRRPRVTLQR